MPEKDANPSTDEVHFDKIMRALIRVSKSEVEELEKQEASQACAAATRAGSGGARKGKTSGQAA